MLLEKLQRGKLFRKYGLAAFSVTVIYLSLRQVLEDESAKTSGFL